MNIAVISEDGKTISQHFGRAPLYVVLTVEDGKVTKKETRAKLGHSAFSVQEEEPEQGQVHDYGPEAQSRHAGMAGAISDCQVLLAGGMGMGAYDSLKQLKIEVVMTDVRSIDDGVKLYLEGKLKNEKELLH